MLALEDLHWADTASMAFLRLVGRRSASHRILLTVTYRDDELTRRHPFYHLLPALIRESDAIRIELAALSPQQIERSFRNATTSRRPTKPV